MRKFIGLLISLLICSFCFSQTNLISSCLGNASTGATSVQNYWGWAYSGPGSPWWNVLDNTGGGIRFKTQTSAAISTGGTYTGRESLIRWDSPYNSAIANGVFSLGVGNGINSTVTGISLTAGIPYTFSGLTEWFNGGNAPTFVVQYSTTQFNGGTSLGTVSPTTSAAGVTASIKYYPFSFTFTPATTGMYFIQFTQTVGLVSNLGAILGFANLSLVANSSISVTGTSNYVYTGSAQGPASVSHTGSTGAVTYSYVGVSGTSYTASPAPPTAVGSYTVTATVAADATYNGATSSAYPFTISIFTNAPTSNLISNCLGSIAATIQNTCGWAYSGPASPWWNTLNSTQGLRFRDQSNAAINGGGTYTGRESLIRWDSPYNTSGTSVSGTFSLGTGDGSTTTISGILLTGGTPYTFSGLAEWYNGGDIPTFSVQYSTAQFSGGISFGTIALTWNSSTLGLKYFPFSMTFTPVTTGTYFIQFTQTAGLVSNAGGMLGLANLSLKPASTISVTGVSNYVYTGSTQGPASVSHTGSTGTVTYSYVGENGTSYTASPTPPTAVGSYSVTATVASDANYNGATSSAYPFNIYPVISSFSGTGTTTLSNGSNITYSPLETTDLVVSSGELVIDQTLIVHSVVVNPGAKLTLNNSIVLTTTNGITLQNTPSGTASFVDSRIADAPLSISGTVQQAITETNRNWYVAIPVSGKSATDITFAGAKIVQRNEDQSHWDDVTGSLIAGVGYIAIAATNSGTTIWSLNGNLISGKVQVSVTRSGVSSTGFNLLGNPYPSYLNWEQVLNMDATNASLLQSSIWYRTATYNSGTSKFDYTFNTYNSTGRISTPTGTTGYIPPMQAFWVRANNVGTVTFSNAMRSHGDGASNKLKAPKLNTQKIIRLQVSNNANTTDETVLYFDENAQNSFDAYDSQKMSNNSTTIPEIFTLAGTEQLVINGMESVTLNQEIPLGFTTGQLNAFSIKASEISNFDSGTQVILKDNQTNNEWNLSDGSSYNFISDITTSNTSRFSIVFKAASITTGNINNQSDCNSIQIYRNANNLITVNFVNGIAGQNILSVYNAIGQKIEERTLTSTRTVLEKSFTPGVYMVNVLANGKSLTQKLVIN